MPGAPFCNCAAFSASDIRRIKSFARADNVCDGSRQIAGSLISGMCVAPAEKASASSEALNATTGAPEEFLISNVLNFATPLLAAKEIVSGPLIESSSCSTTPVMEATFRAPPAAAMMSKFLASSTSPEVTSNTLSPGAPASVSASPMPMVYLPAGKCAMLTVKFVPLISSRNAAALSAAPSMVTDALSLRCAKSPLTLTCCPQVAQISSAAKAAGTESHRLAADITDKTASIRNGESYSSRRITEVSASKEAFLD